MISSLWTESALKENWGVEKRRWTVEKVSMKADVCTYVVAEYQPVPDPSQTPAMAIQVRPLLSVTRLLSGGE